MTQDEVDLIYDYLHENYEYVDGEFISIVNNKKLSGFCAQSARMRATLHINKKDYFVRYAALVWIYHHKEIFYSYDYKDKNTVNNKIENLIPMTSIEQSYIKRKSKLGYREILLKNGSIKYMVEINMGNKSYNFGRYNNKNDAKKCYTLAKQLWVTKKIDPLEIKKILIEKNIIQERKIILKIKNEKKIPKGYTFDKRDKKYYAYHYINKKRIGLGSFKTPQEAHEAYLNAKKELTQS